MSSTICSFDVCFVCVCACDFKSFTIYRWIQKKSLYIIILKILNSVVLVFCVQTRSETELNEESLKTHQSIRFYDILLSVAGSFCVFLVPVQCACFVYIFICILRTLFFHISHHHITSHLFPFRSSCWTIHRQFTIHSMQTYS